MGVPEFRYMDGDAQEQSDGGSRYWDEYRQRHGSKYDPFHGWWSEGDLPVLPEPPLATTKKRSNPPAVGSNTNTRKRQ